MLWLYLRGADARVMAGKEATRVLIATKQIPAGTSGAEIKKGSYVEVVTMPKTSVPADALTAIDEALEGLVLNADVERRQLLLRGAFDQPTELSGGLRIPEGKVAISVPVITTAGMGYVEPGSQIAFYDTFTLMEGKNGVPAGDDFKREHSYNHATRLVLPKAEVIAVGVPGQVGARTSADKDGSSTDIVASEGDAPVQAITETTVVTVALTQAEAERLIHAAQTGKLYIALLDDTSELNPGPGVDYDSLFK